VVSKATTAALMAAVWALAPAGTSFGQDAPTPGLGTEPHRFSLGGEALATASTGDPGGYNYTDYGQSALRLVRARLSASLRVAGFVSLLGELRVDNGDGFSVSALYLRLHPWRDHALDIQAGRIPPVFGAFGRRAYGYDNPLIGLPLGYQYLLTLRPDAIPLSANDVLRLRGQGTYTAYPLGSPTWSYGMPIVALDRWDTGVQVRVGQERVSLSAAVTQGTLSDPRVRDDNGDKQLVTRAEWRPALGLVLGASAASGGYLTRQALDTLPASLQHQTYAQRALGFDAEYSRGYWLLRGEAILSEWQVPAVQAPLIKDPLRAWTAFLETRLKLRPGLYVAARGDHIGFSSLAGSYDYAQPLAWDIPVSRVELGGGFSPRRWIVLKASYQYNWRSSGPNDSASIAAGQVLLWF